MCSVTLQVRPNDNIRFKKISLEEAYTAIFKTDALVEALTKLAHGKLTLAEAQQQLDGMKVRQTPFRGGG
jgi:allophanate hydrolase subunit 2